MTALDFHDEIIGLSAKKAAVCCGVSLGSLRKYGPPPARIGRRCVYSVDVLKKWLAGNAAAQQTLSVLEEEQKALAAIDWDDV